MKPGERISELRLGLRRRHEAMGSILNQLLSGGPLMEGSVYSRRRRCGKPQCRCVRGQLHEDRVVAVRRGGRVVVRCLDPISDAAMEEAVVAGRLFRRRRRDLAKACQDLLKTVDRLARLRQGSAGGLC